MQSAYLIEIRLRSIWLQISVGYIEEETSYLLAFPPITVRRYIQRYVASGSVSWERIERLDRHASTRRTTGEELFLERITDLIDIQNRAKTEQNKRLILF